MGPFSGGSDDISILKSFKIHVADDIWNEEVIHLIGMFFFA